MLPIHIHGVVLRHRAILHFAAATTTITTTTATAAAAAPNIIKGEIFHVTTHHDMKTYGEVEVKPMEQRLGRLLMVNQNSRRPLQKREFGLPVCSQKVCRVVIIIVFRAVSSCQNFHTNFWLGNLKGKRPLRRPRRRWEDNIKINLRKTGCEGVNWT